MESLPLSAKHLGSIDVCETVPQPVTTLIGIYNSRVFRMIKLYKTGLREKKSVKQGTCYSNARKAKLIQVRSNPKIQMFDKK